MLTSHAGSVHVSGCCDDVTVIVTVLWSVLTAIDCTIYARIQIFNHFLAHQTARDCGNIISVNTYFINLYLFYCGLITFDINISKPWMYRYYALIDSSIGEWGAPTHSCAALPHFPATIVTWAQSRDPPKPSWLVTNRWRHVLSLSARGCDVCVCCSVSTAPMLTSIHIGRLWWPRV